MPVAESTPSYTQVEAHQHETFTALMNALSFPGRLFELPDGDAFALIADTLLDLETSWYTSDAPLTPHLAHTGARGLPPEDAAYHFYPHALDLASVAEARLGDMYSPDQAATLIIRCAFLETAYEFSGPGVETVQALRCDLPAEFWELRARVDYPLGWDVFLTDGRWVVGLPRTTAVRTLDGEVA